MRALVTGGSGFIGSHIVSHLVEMGDEVRGLVRRGSVKRPGIPRMDEVSWCQGDLTDPASLRAATEDVDVVYHAAALLHAPSSHLLREVNVIGLKNLLEACAESRVMRLVFISSVSVYASSRSKVIREDAPLGGVRAYGKSKVEAEELLRSHAGSLGVGYSIVRPCVVYGERDIKNFTPQLVRLMARPVVPVIAGSRAHMIVVHAADVARAAVLAGTHPRAAGQAFNVTGGRPTSMRQLATVYQELIGRRKFMLPIPMPVLSGALLAQWLLKSLCRRDFDHIGQRFRNGEYQRSFFLQMRRYDISKAQSELGFEPGINLRQGLSRTLAWYQQVQGEK